MNDRLLYLLSFYLLCCLAVACSGRATPPTPTAAPLTSYQNDTLGFVVQYPATWHIRETEDGLIELKSDLDTTLDASYTGGSIVQIMALPQLFYAEQEPLEILNTFSDDILTLMQTEDAASAVLSDPTATTVNGQPAAGMLLSARQGTIQTYAEVYIIAQNDNAALMMLVYPQNQATHYRDSLDIIVNRFQLLRQ